MIMKIKSSVQLATAAAKWNAHEKPSIGICSVDWEGTKNLANQPKLLPESFVN